MTGETLNFRDLDDLIFPDYCFELAGKIVPKARPRVSNSQAFMPEKYRTFQDEATFEFGRQAKEQALNEAIAVPVKIEIFLIGNHRKSADLDNLAGSILDALVKAEIIEDDNLKILRELSIKFSPSKVDPFARISLFLLDKRSLEISDLKEISEELGVSFEHIKNNLKTIWRRLDGFSC